MKRVFPFLAVVVMAGCSQSAAPTAKSSPPKDPKMAAIQERIDKTTPEGKQIVQKVLAMKPEVNEQISGKTLGEVVDISAKNNAEYSIKPIGWEATQKKSGRWKIAFDYQDWQKQYVVAEWEYNPETNKVYPFEQDHAKEFWVPAETPTKGKAKK